MSISRAFGRSFWLGSTIVLISTVVLILWAVQGQQEARGDATSTLFSPSVATSTVGSAIHIEVVGTGLDSTTDSFQLNLQHSSAISITNSACEGAFQGAFKVGPVAVTGGSLIACTVLGGGSSPADGPVMSFDLTSNVTLTETITFGTGPTFKTIYAGNGFELGPGTLNSLDVSFAGTMGVIVGTIQLQNQTVTPGEITLTLSPGGQTTTTDGNGDFSFPGIAPGIYSVLAELPGFLSAQRVNINVSDQQIDIGTTELRSGDVNRDGAITIQDISTVASNFGSGSPQPW